MSFLRRSILALRTLLWVLAASLGVFVVATTAGVIHEREQILQAVHAEALKSVEANMGAVAVALWSYDKAALSALLQGMTRVGSMVRIEVLDDQSVVAEGRRPGEAQRQDRQWSVPVMAPAGGRQIGTLRVTETHAGADELISATIGTLVLTELAKIIGLAFILFVIVYRQIARHLHDLAEQVIILDPNRLGSQVALDRRHNPHRRDELDTLVEAINRFLRERSEEMQKRTLAENSLRESMAEIEFQAFHDPLTELGNRSMLARDLGEEIERAGRDGSRIAVLSVDLDNFKNINDALGHTIGDILLKELARRFLSTIPAPGWVTRHGGDEFIIVLPQCSPPEKASDLARAVMASIAEPFHIEQHELRITSSIGISFYPDHGLAMGELISNADMAMYEAKREGRNTCRFFETDLYYRSTERLAMENGLRIALAEKQFSLVFQPKVTVASGGIHAVEALLRWQRTPTETVSPAAFIPVAEETGLIIDIGDWVLRESLAAARRLRTVLGRDLAVAVNVSPIQFRSERLMDTLRDLAAEEPDLPSLLEIELTESALAGRMDEVTAKLAGIKSLGLKIAIDDFGTGYSSLAYLKNFPIDILKIDQAFIRGLHQNPQDKAIVGSVVHLGKSLGFEIVAEGVEEEAHLAILAEMDCDYAQGYLFARPLPEGDLVGRLQEGEKALTA